LRGRGFGWRDLRFHMYVIWVLLESNELSIEVMLLWGFLWVMKLVVFSTCCWGWWGWWFGHNIATLCGTVVLRLPVKGCWSACEQHVPCRTVVLRLTLGFFSLCIVFAFGVGVGEVVAYITFVLFLPLVLVMERLSHIYDFFVVVSFCWHACVSCECCFYEEPY